MNEAIAAPWFFRGEDVRYIDLHEKIMYGKIVSINAVWQRDDDLPPEILYVITHPTYDLGTCTVPERQILNGLKNPQLNIYYPDASVLVSGKKP